MVILGEYAQERGIDAGATYIDANDGIMLKEGAIVLTILLLFIRLFHHYRGQLSERKAREKRERTWHRRWDPI